VAARTTRISAETDIINKIKQRHPRRDAGRSTGALDFAKREPRKPAQRNGKQQETKSRISEGTTISRVAREGEARSAKKEGRGDDRKGKRHEIKAPHRSSERLLPKKQKHPTTNQGWKSRPTSLGRHLALTPENQSRAPLATTGRIALSAPAVTASRRPRYP